MTNTASPSVVLHYIFDPLCGWCYAAAPLVKAARNVPGLSLRWHAGGMLTGEHKRTIDAQFRDYVLPHDQRIEAMTGQPFGDAYTNGLLLAAGTVLDSEPPITALLAAEQLGGLGLEMLSAEQKAYYVDGQPISAREVLVKIAADLGLPATQFDAAYMALQGQSTQEHIQMSRQLLGMVQGQGFPTFALEFDHPEQPGQRAIQRVDIGPWLSDVPGWVEQLGAWVTQIGKLQATDTEPAAAPAATDGECGADGCALPDSGASKQ